MTEPKEPIQFLGLSLPMAHEGKFIDREPEDREPEDREPEDREPEPKSEPDMR